MPKNTELFKEAVALLKAKIAGVPDSERFFLGFLVIAHIIAHVYETETRDGTDEERAVLKADIMSLVHEVFGLIDIPYVPKSMEVMFEGLITAPLSEGLDYLHNKFAEVRKELDEVLKKAV